MLKIIEEWEVLTPNGWSSFGGIKISSKEEYIIVETDKNVLKCSLEHKIKLSDGTFNLAINLKTQNELYNNEIIKKIEIIKEKIEVYDLFDVEKDNEYFTNNIISHNCAHVEGMDEIWTSLYSTLSTGGAAIVNSTPNGAQGWYYETCMKAQNQDNDFNLITLHWYFHPDRDEEWFINETKNMVPRQIAQELLCSFNQSGTGYFEDTILERIKKQCSVPTTKDGPNQNLWIWERYDKNYTYFISADVARGDGEDFSAAIVYKVETDEIVAEFKGQLRPDIFSFFFGDAWLRIRKMFGFCRK